MKLNALEKIIRKVVREEIEYALAKELKVLKEGNFTPSVQKSSTKTSLPPRGEFTKNTSLNSILNETANQMTREDFQAMNGRGQPSIMDEAITLNSSVPDPVAKAVTRDYSDLMRAIEAKKS